MSEASQIVITGIGVVSPIGIGIEPFWKSLHEGTSGVRLDSRLQGTEMPVRFGGEIIDFDGKLYVTHNTWNQYALMLRFFKFYDFPSQDSRIAADKVMFSSRPGDL